MSFRVWLDEERVADLGHPFVVLPALSEIARVDGPHDALRALVNTDDQDLDAGYAQAVVDEARAFLAQHGSDVSDVAREILEQLVRVGDGEIEGPADDEDEDEGDEDADT